MSAKRPERKKHRPGKSAGGRAASKSDGGAPARGANTVRARKVAGEAIWELVHPRCARDRQEDLEEVRKMLDAGEIDVAIDECRWLLQGCTDCMEAHRMLGEVALEQNDLPLARGHFGYAFRLGTKALENARSTGPLPYRVPANRVLMESGKGLAWCLKQLGKREMAAEVIETMLRCDPSDPLAVKDLLSDAPAS